MKKYFPFVAIVVVGAIVFAVAPHSTCISHEVLNCKRYKSTKVTLEEVRRQFDQKKLKIKKRNGIDEQLVVDGFHDAWGREIMYKVGKNEEPIFFRKEWTINS